MDAVNEGYAVAGVLAQANQAAHQLQPVVAGQANPAAQILQADLVNDEKPFELVVSRKFGMPRGANRGVEEDHVPDWTDYIPDLEFEWYPKSGTLRKVRLWAQLKKAGSIMTNEGPAAVVHGYPCSEES